MIKVKILNINSLKKENYQEDIWSYSVADKTLALHVAGPGLITGTPYGSLSTKSDPWAHQVWPKNKEGKKNF